MDFVPLLNAFGCISVANRLFISLNRDRCCSTPPAQKRGAAQGAQRRASAMVKPIAVCFTLRLNCEPLTRCCRHI